MAVCSQFICPLSDLESWRDLGKKIIGQFPLCHFLKCLFNQLCALLHLLMKFYFWPGFYFRQIVCFCVIVSVSFCIKVYPVGSMKNSTLKCFSVWCGPTCPMLLLLPCYYIKIKGCWPVYFSALSTYPCFYNQQILMNSYQNSINFLPII